jgi:peptidoglycan-associated lipoprotein
MYKKLFTMMLAIVLAIALIGLSGCAGKKKPPVEPAKKVEKAPEKAPAPAPVVVKEEPKIVEEKAPSIPEGIAFDTIYFDFDKSNIRPDQVATMNKNAELLAKYPTIKLSIEGNCDERGTNEYNLALGQRRADAAKNFLITYGIDVSRLSTVSYGEERPVDTGHSETAWAKNRRSEFAITAK